MSATELILLIYPIYFLIFSSDYFPLMVKVAYKETDVALENKSSINRKCKPASPGHSKAYKNKSIAMLNQAKADCNAEFVPHSSQTNNILLGILLRSRKWTDTFLPSITLNQIIRTMLVTLDLQNQ